MTGTEVAPMFDTSAEAAAWELKHSQATSSTPPVENDITRAHKEAKEKADAQRAQEDYAADVAREVRWLNVREHARQFVEEERNPRSPIELVTEAEILSRPAPEWWVEGILPKDVECLVAAPGGLGKSLLAMHLVRCMASGMQFFGGREVKQAKTLYVIAEGASAFGKRARAWNSAHHHYAPAIKDGSIAYIERNVNLGLTKSVDELREVFRAGDFDILVIDTLSQLAGITNELDNSKIAEAIKAVRSIREVKPGASSILIHHTDAAATKARGGSAYRDNVDMLWMLKADQGGGFSMSTQATDGGKSKDSEPVKLNGFKVESHLDSAVITYTGKMSQHRYFQPIMDALSNKEWLSAGDLREACEVFGYSGKDYDAWKAYVGELVSAGTLEKSGTGKGTKYKRGYIPGS